MRIKNRLTKRLLPLYIASFAQWLTLWVAIEKLFMVEIGFDAASIGLMAAAYAVFVPLIEIPSGVIADRWSRKGMLIIASLASMLSALVGALSQDPSLYVISALLLGVFFALASGTFDAVVYDTVMEENGDSKEFEKRGGHVRLFNSVGGLLAALAGGALATFTSLRMTYIVTIFTVGISVFALLKFKEPQLHKMEVATSFKDHIIITYKTLLQKGKLLPLVILLVLTAMLVQALLEFGQLWLVDLAAPTVLYGLAFAGLTAALGFGGLLAGRIKFHKPLPLAAVVVALLLCCFAMIFVHNTYLVTLAQIALITLVIVISILFTKLMHDAIPSNVRGGVASGVSAFSWMIFVPFSVLFGWIGKEYGVFTSGWLILATTALICVILVKVSMGKVFRAERAEELSTHP